MTEHKETVEEALKAAEETWVGITLRGWAPFFGRLRDASPMGEGRVLITRIDRQAMCPHWREITALRLLEPPEGVPRTVCGEEGSQSGTSGTFWIQAEAGFLSDITRLFFSTNTVYSSEAAQLARLLAEDIRRLLH